MIDLPSNLPGDWDPKPDKRSLVRNAQTGDLGYLVKRSGKVMVRLDRPQEILRSYREAEWLPEEAQRPLVSMHVARIAFEADKALCAALGMHLQAKREWTKLSESERHLWLTKGPTRPPARAALYAHVQLGMKEYIKGGTHAAG